MTTRISEASVNSMADTQGATFDGGSVEYWSGTQPITADTAATGVLIASVTLNSPAFTGVAVAGFLALDVTGIEATVVADGSVGYARFKRVDGTTVIQDGSVTVTGGGGDLIIDNTAVLTGDIIRALSFSITMPKE